MFSLMASCCGWFKRWREPVRNHVQQSRGMERKLTSPLKKAFIGCYMLLQETLMP
uniref:ADP ribosylation factor like GTPase 13B n=1 Tax=Homo sapiens TaxID=9606 RepID=A0A7P0T8M9_HUMAN